MPQPRFESLFRSIAEAVSADTGVGFFRSLVLHLGRCPGIDHAFIGELTGGDPRSVRTIAMCSHGRIVDNIVYVLDGTPCDQLLDRDTSVYARNVEARFPADTLLATMGVEGYAGTPLRDSSGTVLGVMVMLSEREMPDPELTRSILQIFAARAAAELERSQMEDRITRRLRVEQAVAAVSQAFISGDPADIPAILATLGDALGAGRAFVLGADPGGGPWRSFTWTRDPERLPSDVFEGANVNGIARWVGGLPGADPVVIGPEPPATEDGASILPVAAGDTIVAVPIRGSAGAVIGVVGVNDVGGNRRWSSGDIQSLRVVSGMLSTHWERRSALTRLEESEAQYHRLFEEDITANVIAAADGTILDCNAAFARIFGFPSPRAARGTNAQRLCISPEARKEFWDKLRTRHRLAGHETQLTRLGGEPVSIIGNIHAVLDDRGEITRIVGHLFDITARRALEEQLRQSQKMEAVGRLAGGVAHDFNNLLTVISGYSQLVLMKLPEGHPARTDTEEVIKAGERAASLTRQLLAFSRKRPLTPKIIDVNDLVMEMEKMLHRLIGENIELTTTLDPDAGPIKADPGGIEQVIMNLAINARDAMPAGGRLSIETTAIDLDMDYARRHVGVEPGRHVRITVRDTGAGMTEDVQSNIFEPFFSTKENGTGLGLAMVYGIIKQSGGHIRVSSVANRGTVFRVYLPQVRGKVESTRPHDAADANRAGTETILLVEDEDLVRHYARRVLSQRGYNILEARFGEEALRVSRSHTGPIHLMLTDVVMPKMDGRALAQEMKSRYPDIKVMFMSGYAGGSIDGARTERGAAFVQKPFTPQTLVERIRRLLDAPPAADP